ncbi:class I SAM-dependent methyltransferase [Balneolales bacterium ANBcel1]|nr:class I SAM-dependent methyltransferase [Balneolales bacterium ANBcel1]
MREFWDERFLEETYAYGEEPNRFFREQLDTLTPGMLLLPGEGEGRNAVYAARNGWQVDAVDWSRSGKEKADRLAAKHGVDIRYHVTPFEGWDTRNDRFDVCGVIFFHQQPEDQARSVWKMINSLKPGGLLLMELYEKDQLGRSSGGPQNDELLYTKDQVAAWLDGMDVRLLEKREVTLNEGRYHNGPASVIRVIARK